MKATTLIKSALIGVLVAGTIAMNMGDVPKFSELTNPQPPVKAFNENHIPTDKQEKAVDDATIVEKDTSKLPKAINARATADTTEFEGQHLLTYIEDNNLQDICPMLHEYALATTRAYNLQVREIGLIEQENFAEVDKLQTEINDAYIHRNNVESAAMQEVDTLKEKCVARGLNYEEVITALSETCRLDEDQLNNIADKVVELDGQRRAYSKTMGIGDN